MKLILFVFTIGCSLLAEADNFSSLCESQWTQEALSAEFTSLLEMPEKINRDSAQNSLQQKSLNELEMRLLQKSLALHSNTRTAADELHLLLSLQVPCARADLTASGVPVMQSDYSSMQKQFSYFEVPRAEADPLTNRSYDTVSSSSWKGWKWVAVAALVVAGVYFQQNYQIEY